jgi:hypothetical protein
MTDTLDELTEEAAFSEVIRRAKANSAGKRWLLLAGGMRCEDGRCPLEAAANIERNQLHRAATTLWPETWAWPSCPLDWIVGAADGTRGDPRGWRVRLINELIRRPRGGADAGDL